MIHKNDIGIIILADYRVDTKGYKLIKKIYSDTSARFVNIPDILASVNHLIRRSSNISTIANLEGEKIDLKCIDCLAQHINSSKSGLD